MITQLQRLVLCFACLACGSAFGAEHVVKMLNTGKDGPMAFEPGYLRAAPGDTVVFVPAEPGGHNSVSLALPSGATTWKGAFDKEVRIKVEKEGVYLYICEPHRAMGMVGVIQVGKPVNLGAVKAVAAKEQAGFVMNKTRFDQLLANVK